ncbi:MAG: response regulator [Candidatus Omnitrophota bacterium]
MNKLKILIIDDEQQDIKAISTALRREGYTEISTADTGAKGVETANSFKPGLVLIDVVLNGIDGFDICRQIEAIEGIRPKIVMITGHLDAIDAKKARESGADEIIEKTPGFESMIKAVKNLA